MTYIKRSGIDRQVREEKAHRQQAQHTMNVMSGATRSKGAMREDYKLCRENDKQLADFRRFKDKGTREEISKNMEQVRREYGHG